MVGARHSVPVAPLMAVVLTPPPHTPVAWCEPPLERVARRPLLEVLLLQHPRQARPQHVQLVCPHRLDAVPGPKRELHARTLAQAPIEATVVETALQRGLGTQVRRHVAPVRWRSLSREMRHRQQLIKR